MITKRKYGNIKCEYRGIKFDSKKERDRYIELESLRAKGIVSNIIPQYKVPFMYEGKKMFNLIVDFYYFRDGEEVYEDVKAKMRDGKYLTTPVFNLKKKLIEAQHEIKITLF